MQRTYTIFTFLFSLLILTSCSTNRKLQQGDTATTKLKKRSVRYLQKELNAQTLDVEWLSARAKITYKDPTQTRTFNADIRMRKDSVIWMRIKKIKVEAFRILITTDSIYVIDRLKHEYYVEDLKLVEEKFNFPGQFQALQTAILGNPYFFEKQKLIANIANQQYHLTGDNGVRTKSDYFLNGQSYNLEQMAFFDVERDRKLNIFLEEYAPVLEAAFQFAHHRQFEVESEETGNASIKMKFSKVELNVPKTIKFSISSRYKLVKK
ncbi:MAG: DUF4292 domain-containing protein [Saprospiraceae bacterium]